MYLGVCEICKKDPTFCLSLYPLSPPLFVDEGKEGSQMESRLSSLAAIHLETGFQRRPFTCALAWMVRCVEWNSQRKKTMIPRRKKNYTGLAFGLGSWSLAWSKHRVPGKWHPFS